jgi:hypothetical protein
VASFKSDGNPAELNIFGPTFDPQARAIWLSDFQYKFSIQDDKGRFSDARREWYFDQAVGNCTCETQQWAADNAHQQHAEKERMERELSKLKVQKLAKKGVRPIRGASIPYCEMGEGERLRLTRMPSKRTAVNIAGVVGEAVQRCGHSLV